MRGLEREYGDQVSFVWANVLDDNNAALIRQYSFGATPEIYLVGEAGKIIGFWDELEDAAPLREALDAALAGSP